MSGDVLGQALLEMIQCHSRAQPACDDPGLTNPKASAPLLFSPRVKELLALLQNRFDHIILDTAPVFPFSDARLLGQYADGVLLVVRAGVTTQEDAREACKIFMEDDVPVLGTILNDWLPDPARVGYRNYYNYYADQSKPGI